MEHQRRSVREHRSNQIILVLYLTGIRHAPAANPGDGNGVAESVIVTFQGVQGIVDYAGITPGYVGLDQANVRIPWALGGLGNVSVKVFVSDGQGGMRESNQVTIRLGGQTPDVVSPPIMPWSGGQWRIDQPGLHSGRGSEPVLL